MVNMFLFLALCITVNSVFVKAECDIGTSVIQNFDMDRFLGEWYLLYISKDYEVTLFCFVDTYTKNGSSYNITTRGIHRSGGTEEYGGPVTVSNNTLYLNYGNSDGLSGLYTVLDRDYDNYAIMSGCPENRTSAMTYVQVRNLPADERLLSTIKNALQQTGHNIEDMDEVTCSSNN